MCIWEPLLPFILTVTMITMVILCSQQHKEMQHIRRIFQHPEQALGPDLKPRDTEV